MVLGRLLLNETPNYLTFTFTRELYGHRYWIFSPTGL